MSAALRLPYCFDTFLNVAQWSLFASWEQNLGEGQSSGGDPQKGRGRDGDRGEGERREGGRKGDIPFGTECDCLTKMSKTYKTKTQGSFKAVVLRLHPCPSDAETLVFRIAFKANFYFSFCFCFWQKVGVNQVDHWPYSLVSFPRDSGYFWENKICLQRGHIFMSVKLSREANLGLEKVALGAATRVAVFPAPHRPLPKLPPLKGTNTCLCDSGVLIKQNSLPTLQSHFHKSTVPSGAKNPSP